jgi:hypothetical protein
VARNASRSTLPHQHRASWARACQFILLSIEYVRAVRALARQTLCRIRAGVRALRVALIGARVESRPTPTVAPAVLSTQGAPQVLPLAAPVTNYASLDDYVRSSDAFTLTRPDLVAARAYNHAMVDVVDAAASLPGRILLDVGASPHGFSLERTLAKDASAYLGVGSVCGRRWRSLTGGDRTTAGRPR